MARLSEGKSTDKGQAPGLTKGVLQTFRKSTDLEQFYRFVHENGLRREALRLLEYILHKVKISQKRKRRGKAKKKLQ